MPDTSNPVTAEEPTASAQESAIVPKVEEAVAANGTLSNGAGETSESKEAVVIDALTEAPEVKQEPTQTVPEKVKPADKPTPTGQDEEVESPNADTKSDVAVPASGQPAEPSTADTPTDTPASTTKSKARRKSGITEHKGKKLNKKASKVKLLHTDAKPGDQYFIRLKGYPLWPGIICDESMIPPTLLKNRPVTAARPDGSYREDFEDGGPKVKDRSFPAMYLQTNEFGWIPNHDLIEINYDDLKVNKPPRKDLAAAYQLAGEKNDLEFYKAILKQHADQKEAEEATKAAAKAAKAAKKEKKADKSAKTVAEDGDGDLDMPDADLEEEAEEAEEADPAGKKPLKRKHAETGQEGEPSKKPRIKLTNNNAPKTPNGTSTPKAAKEQSAAKSGKATKPKAKKAAAAKTPEAPAVVAPKEPKMSAEQKREEKHKQIMFLRHKLQKGLLTKDQPPKPEDMPQMADFVTKLEFEADLDPEVIRATKINKVLKAMIKLPSIPQDDIFKFKSRSEVLLSKWNKLLSSEQGTPAVATASAATTNGSSGNVKASVEGAKGTSTKTTNGLNGSSPEAGAVKESSEVKAEEKAPEAKPAEADTKETTDTVEDPAATSEEPTKVSAVEPAVVESTA